MYLQNKYYKWYKNIIECAKNRPLPDCYIEKHHIIPKSLGGENSKENLVYLTAKEHFVCHLLLPKFTTGKNKAKMQYALWMMINVSNRYHDRYKINSQLYENLKQNLRKTFSVQHKNKNKTDEHCRKISESRKKLFEQGSLKIQVYDTTREKLSKNRLGTIHSENTKIKIGKAHKGKVISIEQREHLSKLNTGKIRSQTTKNKISKTIKEQYANGERKPVAANGERKPVAGMLGKKLSEEAKTKMRKPKKRGICPHCGKEGGMNGLKRYHYDNCNLKGSINGTKS